MEDLNYWVRAGRRRVSRRSVLKGGAAVGLGTALGGSLLACGSGESEDSPSGGGSSGGQAERITVALGEEPETLDPHKLAGGVSYFFMVNVFETLLRRDLDGRLVTGLAEDYSVAPDGSMYEFRLREGATFHNGDPVTANDVKFSYERAMDPATKFPFAGDLKNIDRIEVVDDRTIRLHMKAADAYILSAGGRIDIVPQKYLEQVGDQGFGEQPIGTGPFKFVRRSIKESFELEAFEGHWGLVPHYKQALFRIVPENESRVAMLRTGEADIVHNVPAFQAAELQGQGGIQIIPNQTNENIFLLINNTDASKPWADRRVRQAMSHAIDRDAIVENVLAGSGIVSAAGVAPGVLGHDPDLKPYEYNPDKARELLAEAGYPDGFDMTFYGMLGSRVPMSKEVGEAVAGYLEEIGIRAQVENLEYRVWLSLGRVSEPPDLDSVAYWLWGDGATADPLRRLYGTLTDEGAYSYTADPKIKELLAENNALPSLEERDAHLRQVFQIVYDEMYIVPLYTVVLQYGVQPHVDWQPTKGSPYIQLYNAKPKA